MASNAAANYLHVGYFPCSADYDILYGILLRVADIAVFSFSETHLLYEKMFPGTLTADIISGLGYF
jgi:hypothetical protein